MKLQQLVTEVVLDNRNTQKMYELACEYDRLEQGAAAACFFLRAADWEEKDHLLQYKALIKTGLVYQREGRRGITVMGLFQNAIQLIPHRPEAYYFLAKHYESNDDWRMVLLNASTGLSMAKEDDPDIGIGYPGINALKILYAKARWKNAGMEDGKELLFDLKFKERLSPSEQEEVTKYISNIGYPAAITYKNEDHFRYKFPFPGMQSIQRNYARHFQDMFVLSVLDGKTGGSFVEIGCGDPVVHNNTLLLEKKFNWTGLSVDNDSRHCYNYKHQRKTSVFLCDALNIDYKQFFKMNCFDDNIDLLRINSENTSLEVLKRIPFDDYQFNIIQFQHNECWWGDIFKTESRKILEELGYVLLVPDVCVSETQNYEDWWVHPTYYKPHMRSNKDKIFVWDYVMHEIK